MSAMLHPEMEVVAKAKRAFNRTSAISDSRSTFTDYVAATSKPHPSDMLVDDLEFTGPEPGQTVPVRWYRPAAAKTPSPCVLYFHGGGFCFGDLNSYVPAGRLPLPGSNTSASTVPSKAIAASSMASSHPGASGVAALAATTWSLGR